MASPDAPQTTSAPAPVRGNAEMTTFLADRTQDELREFQANKGDIYDAVQMRALGSVTSAKLQKASAGSLVTVAAILEDKARLIRGQASSIHVHALVDVLDALRMREEQE